MTAENRSAPAHIHTADLLTARQWVVRAIAAPARESGIAWPEGLSAGVLTELLTYERCAAWLLDSLSSAGLAEGLPANVLEAIRKAAARETQTAMQARAEGRELSSVAARLGLSMAVLKGGVRAIAGESPSLPVVDIDVLVDHGHVSQVVTELERSGFGRALPALRHHQGVEAAKGRLSVEVHWTMFDDGRPLDPELWSRIIPIAASPGLFRLNSVDHLMHIVRHALLNHRQRHITIRDTLLAGIAARNCSSDEMTTVQRQLTGAPNEGEAVRMISFGGRLVGAQGESSDPFFEESATFYSAVALAPRLPRALASSAALAFMTEIALGRVAVMRAVKNSVQWRGSSVKAAAKANDRFPRLARPLIGLAHLGYYGISAAIALPMIYRTRDKALRELGRRNL
ncbi:MAG TPA: nucleotidyltransferase family protein [Gemmatimonadaceae bacterium]|nr:nucleotidyltransferase family protein [Gemmatimonadaceae bacterium]